MNENENIEETDSTRSKAAQRANDAVIIATAVITVVGLGKLAYDSVRIGIDEFKLRRATKNDKK